MISYGVSMMCLGWIADRVNLNYFMIVGGFIAYAG